jgi:hypothetical protein
MPPRPVTRIAVPVGGVVVRRRLHLTSRTGRNRNSLLSMSAVCCSARLPVGELQVANCPEERLSQGPLQVIMGSGRGSNGQASSVRCALNPVLLAGPVLVRVLASYLQHKNRRTVQQAAHLHTARIRYRRYGPLRGWRVQSRTCGTVGLQSRGHLGHRRRVPRQNNPTPKKMLEN